jgi:hypothetical protein
LSQKQFHQILAPAIRPTEFTPVRHAPGMAESQYPCGFQPLVSSEKRPVIPCCYQAPWTPARTPPLARRRTCCPPGRPSTPGRQKAVCRARHRLPGRPGRGRTRARSTRTWCGLPGPSGPDPGTVVRARGVVQGSGMRAPPQIQQPAPHLRVVSRREIGKKLP